jgi:hypothetical protein
VIVRDLNDAHTPAVLRADPSNHCGPSTPHRKNDLDAPTPTWIARRISGLREGYRVSGVSGSRCRISLYRYQGGAASGAAGRRQRSASALGGPAGARRPHALPATDQPRSSGMRPR